MNGRDTNPRGRGVGGLLAPVTFVGAVSAAVLGCSVLGCSMLGCSGADGAHPPADRAYETLRRHDGGAVVARVDDHPISAEEFQTYWRRHPQLGRQEAIDAVVDRQLLVDRALAAGHRDHGGLQVARKSAMVRALLNESVEARVTHDDLSDQAVDTMVDRLRAQVGHPPGLRVTHLVVSIDAERQKKASSEQVDQWFDEAHGWLGDIRDTLPEAPTAVDMLRAEDQFSGEVAKPLAVRVDAHIVFPVGKADRYGKQLPDGWRPVVPEFRAAAVEMFENDRLGGLSEPVKTSYGWHLLVVEQALPAAVGDAGALRDVAESRLVDQQRRKRLAEVVESWMDTADIETFPQVISEAQEHEN